MTAAISMGDGAIVATSKTATRETVAP
jgi:hypothetical protein